MSYISYDLLYNILHIIHEQLFGSRCLIINVIFFFFLKCKKNNKINNYNKITQNILFNLMVENM